jgi:proline dehydrogenase
VSVNPLRPAILAASRSRALQSVITRAAPTRRIVERFIAGEDMPQALESVRAMLSTGRMVTVDFLGEDTVDRAQADAALAEYVRLVTRLGDLHQGTRVEVSVKLSALGQALPGDGTRVATHNLHGLCAAAQRSGVLVTVDAEDHTTTDPTLSAVDELRDEFPWLGVVLQAYLHRAEADCKHFAGMGSRVRLCKGAYREPKSVAYQSRERVDESYRRCLEILFSGEGYPMVATHDPAMIDAAHYWADRCRPGRSDAFEHQMLYGIRDDEQRRLAAVGHGMRVYLPYGAQWYPYFTRRLAERPANLAFFLRSLR